MERDNSSPRIHRIISKSQVPICRILPFKLLVKRLSESHHTHTHTQATQPVAIALGCSLKLDAKSLFLKTEHNLVKGNGEIKLVLT